MPILEYHRPADPAAAVALMQRLEVITVPLIPRPRPAPLADLRAQAVVDLSGLKLAYLTASEKEICVGAMTPVQALVEAPALQALAQGLLPEAARLAGHWNLRQLATLQGALLSRKSLPELTLALLALDAEAVVVKADGNRQAMPLAEYLTVQWSPDELMIEMKVPVPAGLKVGAALARVARAPRDSAILAVTAALHLEGEVCRRARVALSHAGSEAELLVAFVPRLEGQVVTAALLQGVAEAVQAAAKPLADFRASAEYRQEMTGVLVRRALETAWRRASA